MIQASAIRNIGVDRPKGIYHLDADLPEAGVGAKRWWLSHGAYAGVAHQREKAERRISLKDTL